MINCSIHLYCFKNLYKHPEYKCSQKYFDIALLRLDSPVVFSNKLYPVCLWTNPNEEQLIEEKTKIFASGFVNIGSKLKVMFYQPSAVITIVTLGQRISPVLLKTALEIVEVDSCNQSYKEARPIRTLRKYIQPCQICAVDSDGRNDMCQANSGGPLQMIVNEQYRVVGVTSFGMFCGSGLPSVYTRVSFYLDWIESIVWP
jgi:secreted trypsin-like serine protease